jgi:hypothetical protein
MSGERKQVKIDLVTHDPKRDAWKLVLVEQGPWREGDTTDNLRRLQERLDDYTDVALFGSLARMYPESRGRPAVIRLDAYDIPEAEVEAFFYRFAEHTHGSSEVQAAIAEHGYVSDLSFEYHYDTLKNDA